MQTRHNIISRISRGSNMTKELERQVNVKFDQRTYLKVEEISERLDLRVSEIIRRAVVEGLKTFRNVQLPGSPTTDMKSP